jgi:hypothetical protein
MSKTLNMLKVATQQRGVGKYSQVAAGLMNEKPGEKINGKPKVMRQGGHWLVLSVLASIFLCNLALNIYLFSSLKDYASEKNATVSKLSRVEELLKDNTQQLKQINLGLGSLKIQAKDTDSKIAEFDKELDSQKFAVNNLVKAKNEIMNRLSAIESRVQQN